MDIPSQKLKVYAPGSVSMDPDTNPVGGSRWTQSEVPEIGNPNITTRDQGFGLGGRLVPRFRPDHSL